MSSCWLLSWGPAQSRDWTSCLEYYHKERCCLPLPPASGSGCCFEYRLGPVQQAAQPTEGQELTPRHMEGIWMPESLHLWGP